jgi:hypothetical protein
MFHFISVKKLIHPAGPLTIFPLGCKQVSATIARRFISLPLRLSVLSSYYGRLSVEQPFVVVECAAVCGVGCRTVLPWSPGRYINWAVSCFSYITGTFRIRLQCTTTKANVDTIFLLEAVLASVILVGVKVTTWRRPPMRGIMVKHIGFTTVPIMRSMHLKRLSCSLLGEKAFSLCICGMAIHYTVSL